MVHIDVRPGDRFINVASDAFDHSRQHKVQVCFVFNGYKATIDPPETEPSPVPNVPPAPRFPNFRPTPNKGEAGAKLQGKVFDYAGDEQ